MTTQDVVAGIGWAVIAFCCLFVLNELLCIWRYRWMNKRIEQAEMERDKERWKELERDPLKWTLNGKQIYRSKQ